MEAAGTTTVLWILGIIGTLILGLLTNALWDWIKDNLSLGNAKWPKLIGEWAIEHSNGSRQGERVLIRQQFGARFKGELHTPDPQTAGRVLIQIVRGEILDRYHALFTIRHYGTDFTEIGAGLITLSVNPRLATGKSVFFGITAPVEEVASFTVKRQVT